MLIEQPIDLRKDKTENLIFTTDLRLVSNTADDFLSSRLPKIIMSNIEARPVNAGLFIHSISFFLWDQFGCKVLLQAIQNYDRNFFQAFARLRLRWLWCSTGI